MNVRGMHYDVKQKLNKIDSQQYRNLRVPEIDWNLNEAYEIIVKSIAQPRLNDHLGFEINQRSIDDLRTIVINDFPLIPINIDDKSYYVELPEDYLFYISSSVSLTKEGCSTRKATIKVRQHDDEFDTDSFSNSSFEWKEVNITFYENKIKIHTDGTFVPTVFYLNYIRQHAYIHNAQDFLPTGSYTLPDGTVLTGSQDCELPNHIHREIVDIAVLIITNNLDSPSYQFKQAKINFNQLKN